MVVFAYLFLTHRNTPCKLLLLYIPDTSEEPCSLNKMYTPPNTQLTLSFRSSTNVYSIIFKFPPPVYFSVKECLISCEQLHTTAFRNYSYAIDYIHNEVCMTLCLLCHKNDSDVDGM